MTKTELLTHLRPAEIARLLGITVQAVSMWPDAVPRRRLAELQRLLPRLPLALPAPKPRRLQAYVVLANTATSALTRAPVRGSNPCRMKSSAWFAALKRLQAINPREVVASAETVVEFKGRLAEHAIPCDPSLTPRE